jgi:hypothetical protein
MSSDKEEANNKFYNFFYKRGKSNFTSKRLKVKFYKKALSPFTLFGSVATNFFDCRSLA